MPPAQREQSLRSLESFLGCSISPRRRGSRLRNEHRQVNAEGPTLTYYFLLLADVSESHGAEVWVQLVI